MEQVKPKVNIGGKVVMTKNVQTGYGWSMGVWFTVGQKLDVVDIEISTRLATGETKIKYVLSWDSKPKGWVDADCFEVAELAVV